MSDLPLSHRTLLYRSLAALGPYRAQVVLIGGWVPALHRERAELEWRGGLSQTTELDLLAIPPVEVIGTQDLATTLKAAGFAPIGNATASAHWVAKGGAAIEFLIPHQGIAESRGTGQGLSGHHGLQAIALQHARVLVEHVRTITLPPIPPVFPEAIQIRIPTLAAYVVNKGLTFPLRLPGVDSRNEKQGKDVVYLMDVAAAGPRVRQELLDGLREIQEGPTRGARPIAGAQGNLRLAGNGRSFSDALADGAALLSERDRMEEAAAVGAIRGALLDLADCLGEYRD